MYRISIGQLLAILVATLGNFISDRFRPELRKHFESSSVLQYLVVFTAIFSNELDDSKTLLDAVIETTITFAIFVAVSQIHSSMFILLILLCILYVTFKAVDKQVDFQVPRVILYWLIIAVSVVGTLARGIETTGSYRFLTPSFLNLPKQTSTTPA